MLTKLGGFFVQPGFCGWGAGAGICCRRRGGREGWLWVWRQGLGDGKGLGLELGHGSRLRREQKEWGGGGRDLWGGGLIWGWRIGLRVEGDGHMGNGRRRKTKGGWARGLKNRKGRGGVCGGEGLAWEWRVVVMGE
ncbi:unnamed protein product [Prunus armeniaca]